MSGRGAAELWVPYSQRPEWVDVVAVPPDAAAGRQEDEEGGGGPAGGGRVVSIQYSPQHREVLAYFKACLAKGERGERVLELTADVIEANNADYTAWAYRWEVLRAMGADLTREYAFTTKVADECAKNYQLWNHRRKLAAALGPEAAAAELEFCADALEADAKNYHAWAHRQVVVAAARAWQQELAYVDRLLQQDVRNNSAWNQRAFVLQHTLGNHPSLQALLDRELAYVAEQLQHAPDNESAWNYLWGLFRLPGCRSHEMGRQDKVFVICREALADSPSCRPALDALAGYYDSLAALAAEQGNAEAAAKAARHGLAVLAKAAVADPMRANYWRHRERELARHLKHLSSGV